MRNWLAHAYAEMDESVITKRAPPKGGALFCAPGWGQDFCKRQINYMALCLQALPTALHHVKPRSGGEGVPAGANPPAGRVCQRVLTHPGKGYSYLPPSAASDSRHSLSQRTTLRRGAPGRVCVWAPAHCK